MSGYVGRATALSIVLAFVALLRIDHLRKKAGKREWPMPTLIGKAAAAGALVPALFLIYGAFNISDLCDWAGLPAPLALGGACLFYLSFRTAFNDGDENEVPAKLTKGRNSK